MSAVKSARGVRGGLAAAAAAAAAGDSSRKRKASKHTDTDNSNSRAFAAAGLPAAASGALERWRAAQQPSASSASAAAAGVLALDEGDEDLDHSASLARQIVRERALVSSLGPAPLPDTFTANGDASFSSSRVARVDLFFQMVRGAEAAKIDRLCEQAWRESAEHTVQLVLHGRDARSGKGERLVAYHAMLWLRRHKPATYLLNLTTFLALGCFKDLLQLATLVADNKLEPLGAKPREDIIRKAEHQQQREKRRRVQRYNAAVAAAAAAAGAAAGAAEASASDSDASASSVIQQPQQPAHELLELEMLAEYLAADYERLKKHQAKMAARKAKDPAAAAVTVVAPMSDVEEEEERKSVEPAAAPNAAAAAFLADAATDSEDDGDDESWDAITMAEADAAAGGPSSAAAADDGEDAGAAASVVVVRKPRQPRPPREPHCQLSLAAKWAPTEGSSFDKKHGMAKRVARLLFPNEPKCFRLYRELLSQCRAHLAVPERDLCARRWDRIDFEKIPAKCHQRIKAALTKRCGDRYEEYKKKLSSGQAKINTAGILPHELASPYVRDRHISEPDAILEGAWATLLSKLREKCVAAGGLGNAVAVVDVSGSMSCFNGLPMNVAISLGLLVCELAQGPFQHRCITFSTTPRWHRVPSLRSSSLLKQVRSLQGAHWGCSTDLQAVFRLILDTAIETQCSQADMPKSLFIFSDMQFNAAVGEAGKGGCDAAIRAAYARAGFEPPALIYWNLNGFSHSDCPVDISTPNMALIGGYSAELLKAFLDGANIDPLAIMLHSIAAYKAVIEESER